MKKKSNQHAGEHTSRQTSTLTRKEQLVRSMELPADLILGEPLLHITGRSDIFISNFKNIIEYTDRQIKLQTKSCKIMIVGKQLELMNFSNAEIHVIGIIEEIKYYQ